MDYNVSNCNSVDGIEIPGLKVIHPTIFPDDRGYFYESYSEWGFMNNVGYVHFVQENQSKSSMGVIRGLHWQKDEHAQSKLVSVAKGKVLDIALDIRVGSPTFGKYAVVELSEDNHTQFFIPRGFAHGFITYEDDTIFQYKCDNYYNKESECGCNISSINFASLLDESLYDGLKFSEKDRTRPLLKDIPQEDLFVYDEYEGKL